MTTYKRINISYNSKVTSQSLIYAVIVSYADTDLSLLCRISSWLNKSPKVHLSLLSRTSLVTTCLDSLVSLPPNRFRFKLYTIHSFDSYHTQSIQAIKTSFSHHKVPIIKPSNYPEDILGVPFSFFASNHACHCHLCNFHLSHQTDFLFDFISTMLTSCLECLK